MPIPPDIQALINRLNQEINETEQEAIKGLNLVRPILSLFPDNAILVQYFAYINAALPVNGKNAPAITTRLCEAFSGGTGSCFPNERFREEDFSPKLSPQGDFLFALPS